MLNRFYLWIVKDIMPSEDPFLRLKVNLQEVMPRYAEALRLAGITFKQFGEAARHFAETVEDAD